MAIKIDERVRERKRQRLCGAVLGFEFFAEASAEFKVADVRAGAECAEQRNGVALRGQI